MSEYELKFMSVAELLKTLIVPKKTNLKKILFGKEQDGGYVLADLPDYDALYSYGCDDKIHFEQAYHERYGNTCYVYDPFKGITDKPDYIQYFKEGLCAAKMDNMDTLNTHIEANGHQNCKNLLGQIDIEGSEWGVLQSDGTYTGVLTADSKYLLNFSQLIIEFHLPLVFDMANLQVFEKIFKEVFGYLNENFVCIHIHGNNCPLQPWMDGNFPRMFELTYVRKDLVETQEMETDPCPQKGLDFACAPDRAELRLDYWLKE